MGLKPPTRLLLIAQFSADLQKGYAGSRCTNRSLQERSSRKSFLARFRRLLTLGIPIAHDSALSFRLRCVPSQYGCVHVRLHPHSTASFRLSRVNSTGRKSVPLWEPSQKG